MRSAGATRVLVDTMDSTSVRTCGHCGIHRNPLFLLPATLLPATESGNRWKHAPALVSQSVARVSGARARLYPPRLTRGSYRWKRRVRCRCGAPVGRGGADRVNVAPRLAGLLNTAYLEDCRAGPGPRRCAPECLPEGWCTSPTTLGGQSQPPVGAATCPFFRGSDLCVSRYPKQRCGSGQRNSWWGLWCHPHGKLGLCCADILFLKHSRPINSVALCLTGRTSRCTRPCGTRPGCWGCSLLSSHWTGLRWTLRSRGP